MLEIKNLSKTYKPRKGVPVKALDGVSIRFPERGMIFLLGKSGSGKSTLLNLIGGLDRYDGGEITIKGVSSKSFGQQHFDSYRNTYVGFIFQEYNILDEFTVGANIALALELQGKRATDAEINEILREVDLDGYGNRRPNELSGGQKQRVAIARALVKNPAIILADEPTGALDSNTGRQIFDTLKKLSSDKLVIVVSHDREFAEGYADRIIELADGRVIDDVTLERGEQTEAGLSYLDGKITVPQDYQLTEEDRLAINEYIRGLGKGGAEINISRAGKRFVQTDQEKIDMSVHDRFELIKSKLPFKNAFRIGASSLGHKKVRLVFTVILSVIAFTLFGLADTFGAYDHIQACTDSIIDSDVRYASFAKREKRVYGDGEYDYYYRDIGMADADISAIEESTGIHVKGVFAPDLDLSFSEYLDPTITLSEMYDVYSTRFGGFVELTQADLEEMGYTLAAGALPSGDANEIAVSSYILETFMKAGFASEENVRGYDPIKTAADLIGRKLELGGTEYTITGVVDTKFNFDRYVGLSEEDESVDTTDMLIDYALYNEFSAERRYSLCNMVLGGEGFIGELEKRLPPVRSIDSGYIYFHNDDHTIGLSPSNAVLLPDIDVSVVTWLDGQARTELGEKEIIATSDILMYDGVFGYELSEIDMNAFAGLTADSYSEKTGEEMTGEEGWTVVGVIDSYDAGIYGAIVCNEELFDYLVSDSDYRYSHAVGAMPSEYGEIRDAVKFAYTDTDIRYELQSSVTYELNTVNEGLKILSKVFLYIGIGFAAFAALLLANFIGTSIAYKKQQIGILRAIGSRSADVFRIFFSESFIIAMINFLLAALGTGLATHIVNSVIRNNCHVLITVLSFGIRQVLLILAVSIIVAALASFVPVKKIASKRPIDAIRER